MVLFKICRCHQCYMPFNIDLTSIDPARIRRDLSRTIHTANNPFFFFPPLVQHCGWIRLLSQAQSPARCLPALTGEGRQSGSPLRTCVCVGGAQNKLGRQQQQCARLCAIVTQDAFAKRSEYRFSRFRTNTRAKEREGLTRDAACRRGTDLQIQRQVVGRSASGWAAAHGSCTFNGRDRLVGRYAGGPTYLPTRTEPFTVCEQ